VLIYYCEFASVEVVINNYLLTYRHHSKVVDLMEGLYTDTCSCVNVDGVMSDWFAVGSGVRQGCRIAPDLFLGPMDHMMECTVHRGMTGVTLGKKGVH